MVRYHHGVYATAVSSLYDSVRRMLPCSFDNQPDKRVKVDDRVDCSIYQLVYECVSLETAVCRTKRGVVAEWHNLVFPPFCRALTPQASHTLASCSPRTRCWWVSSRPCDSYISLVGPGGGKIPTPHTLCCAQDAGVDVKCYSLRRTLCSCAT